MLLPASGLTVMLLRKFALRHWRAAPKQSALLVLILALGIAVFFSIRLANRAALASFQNFTDLITQESDWLIRRRRACCRNPCCWNCGNA